MTAWSAAVVAKIPGERGHQHFYYRYRDNDPGSMARWAEQKSAEIEAAGGTVIRIAIQGTRG